MRRKGWSQGLLLGIRGLRLRQGPCRSAESGLTQRLGGEEYRGGRGLDGEKVRRAAEVALRYEISRTTESDDMKQK
jgi:hypothetical protein